MCVQIVMTGTEQYAIDDVRRTLQAAGHDVLSCFSDTAPGHSCVGLGEDVVAGGSGGHPCDVACPATCAAEVIVAVRAHPVPHLTRQERIVNCPLLSDVPVVVAGSTILNPFGDRAAALIEGYDDIEGVCTEVAVRCGRPDSVAHREA